MLLLRLVNVHSNSDGVETPSLLGKIMTIQEVLNIIRATINEVSWKFEGSYGLYSEEDVEKLVDEVYKKIQAASCTQ